MTEAHPLDRLSYSQRLERVVERGLPGLHVAEAATPGAGVSENHERGGPALPAIADVRARRLLADRVKLLAVDLRLQLEELRAAGSADLEPGRLTLAERPALGKIEDLRAAGMCA